MKGGSRGRGGSEGWEWRVGVAGVKGVKGGRE